MLTLLWVGCSSYLNKQKTPLFLLILLQKNSVFSVFFKIYVKRVGTY